jgi:3-hydroxymyristoyl/3-hydroxydecanoyl-(acyl carrier protein) dehydratase
MGFLLVDRLVEFRSGQVARGIFAPSPDVTVVPPLLVAEAVGQVAGWLAMEACDFRQRPVAGLAHEVRAAGFDAAGRVFELEAELKSRSEEAIVYNGRATSEGNELIRITSCIGPMLPMEDFDDPERMRRRFAALRESGEDDPLAPDTLEGLALEIGDREHGKWICAYLDVPPSAPFFRDHFPRKPVLPATVLLDFQLRLGCQLAREALGREPDARVKDTRLRGLKIRQFTPPGTRLELEVSITSASGSEALASLTMRRAPPDGAPADLAARGRALGTARLEVVLEDGP